MLPHRSISRHREARSSVVAMMASVVLLLVTLAVGCEHAYSFPQKLKAEKVNNERPIIGILAQKLRKLPGYQGRDYFPASYVRFIQSAGARVVPIRTNLTDEELVRLFRSLNGVLFPGGAAAMLTSGYYKTGRRLYELAMKANDDGDYFPIWATCLGFEMLHVLRLEDDKSVLSRCDGNDYSWPLNLTESAHSSRLLANAPAEIVSILTKQDVTFNHHKMCALHEQYARHERLRNFFSVVSTNRDPDGREFVSTVEAIDYPFYGVQWHPEKNPYEWTTSEKINHSPDAIAATQYMANFFVSETRKNGHRFASVEEETKSLIYNYCPVMTIGITHFEEFYIF